MPPTKHLDLIVTWPKTRPLSSYRRELKVAERNGDLINFHVARAPRVGFLDWAGRPRRCYMVHGGLVRGYNEICDIDERSATAILDPISGEYWPAGTYIVRFPEWYPVEPVPMKGFQGWRYYTYPEDAENG